MIKINLEKKLLKENIERLSNEDKLLLKELANHEDINKSNIDTLYKLGISTLKEADDLKNKLTEKKQETLKFDQTRVFHISQIKSICMKYRLRFLHSSYYKGAVDKDLPVKINTFEIAHNIKLRLYDCKIVAPKSSFKLRKYNEDPLLFYKINDEYYYLIHKWGNDLNIARRLSTIMLHVITNPIFLGIISILIFNISSESTIVNGISKFFGSVISIISLVLLGFCIKQKTFSEFEFMHNDKWNSNQDY